MKKIGLIDIAIILAVIAALVVGFLTYKHFRETAGNQIDKSGKVLFQVFLRGVTITSGYSPFRPNEETFISIRNVPYTNLKIIDVKIDPRKIVLPNPAGKPAFVTVDDASQMFMYDAIVTIVDNAKFTKDGAVVGGNKIKIGLPITLEGLDYKLNGTVSNVQMITDELAKQLESNAVKQQQQLQQQAQRAQQAQQAQQAQKMPPVTAGAPQPKVPVQPVAAVKK